LERYFLLIDNHLNLECIINRWIDALSQVMRYHKIEKSEDIQNRSVSAIGIPYCMWAALNPSTRSREAVSSIKRQRNQIAGAENVRRRRIAAFRGSNQGGIECVCYDASLGSPHGLDKCIIGATNAGDTHTHYGRRARVYEWTHGWKIHRRRCCSRAYSAILMRHTVVVICRDWRRGGWVGGLLDGAKGRPRIRLHERENSIP